MTTEYLPTADGYRKVDDDDNTTTSTPQKTAGVQTATTTTSSSTAANSPAAVLEGDEAATKARKAAAAAGKQKKKRTSAYRRRLRRKGQREEPTLTRLAAVLGQIKEACADQDEVNSKIAPLIESATRMIEALSENQKKSGGADVQKKGREAQSSDDTVQADNNSTSAAKMSSPTERGVVAGSRIPPHVYRPTVPGPTTSSRQQWQRGPVLSSRMMMQPPPMKPPMRNTAIVNKEAVQREMQKSELRTRLRSCRTIEDFQAALNEAERLGLTHEATAARNHINKLMATAAA